MSDCRTYIVVLEPDAAFDAWIAARKRCVRDLVGDQLYLDHPPHVTLYVAAFPPQAELCGPLDRLAERLPIPRAAMNRWHVFQADQLTGHHTLVCEAAPERCEVFQGLQREVVATLAPMRDLGASRGRYDAAWERLSKEERTNVIRYGFPFVGPIWRTHVTIASIRPDDWSAVAPILVESPPDEIVSFAQLALFVLEDGRMRPVERFALRGEECG